MTSVQTKPIRVLVVDDSLTVRAYIADVLREDGAFDVVGEAADGRQAIEMCERLRPDVITMDMMLPVMSGVAATEWIMAYCPTPILVVSSSLNRGEVFRTYDAIAAGAVDVFPKPSPDAIASDASEWAARLKSTVRMVSRIKVITHLKRRLADSTTPPRAAAGGGGGQQGSSKRTLIAIGASTGGPGALRQVLLQLPANIGVPILAVLHIGEPFDATLADWLDAQSSHHVRFAKDGEPLFGGDSPPCVIMSPGAKHLMVRNGKLRLDDGPERHSCKPSVDVLFESLAYETGASTAAALLTGMGKDGAEGLLAIRKAGGFTIAQDEASCVVYGMPKAAADLGAASVILPLDGVASALDHVVRATASSGGASGGER